MKTTLQESLMDQSKTFDRLRRLPIEEMSELIDVKNFQLKVSPQVTWGDYTFDSSIYFRKELELHKWRLDLLAEHGWTFEDFMLASEKVAIRRLIDDYNERHSEPSELIDRIRMAFPNAKFYPARLEEE